MSSVAPAPSPDVPKPPRHYAARADAGDETWLEDAIEDYLDVTVTWAQRQICRSVASNLKTLVITANGLGKSYILAAIANVWLVVRYQAIAFATSGTDKKLKRTFCRPVEALHDNALGGVGLPGTYKHQPERIEIDGEPEHYFEAAKPAKAGELEGVHSDFTLAIIEEADKSSITDDIYSAMNSLPSDDNDRMILIANPPRDESNLVHRIKQRAEENPDSPWNILQFSTFDSHNSRIERGLEEGEKIGGIAGLSKIKQDWVEMTGETWPGPEKARTAHLPQSEGGLGRTDLPAEWYIRRLGIMPPEGAAEHRPIQVGDVESAWSYTSTSTQQSPTAVAIDVARSGDRTVMIGVHEDRLVVHYDEQGANHLEQTPPMLDIAREWPAGQVNYAIDFIGHGSYVHDKFDAAFPNVRKFQANEVAVDETTYKDRWTEGLALLGEWLRAGGSIEHQKLYEQVSVAARTVTYDEKHIKSRGQHGADVLVADSKDVIKDALDGTNPSPDYLDAAMMAVWADTHRQPQSKTRVFDIGF